MQSQDRSLTQSTRKVVGISIAVICSILVSILLWFVYVDEELHSQRLVYYHFSLRMLLSCLFVNYRNTLQIKLVKQHSFHDFRWTFGLTANRFIGWHFENDPNSILIIDNLILGLTVLNATPVLPSGKYLTIIVF